MLWRAHDNTGLGPRRARSSSDLTQTIAMQQNFVDTRQHASALRSRKQLTSRWSQARSTLTTRSAAYDQRATSAAPPCVISALSFVEGTYRGCCWLFLTRARQHGPTRCETDDQIMMTTTPMCYKANGPPLHVLHHYTAQIVRSPGQNVPHGGHFGKLP